MHKVIKWVIVVVVCGTTLLHLLRDGPMFVASADYWVMLIANTVLYVGIFYFFRGVAFLLDRLSDHTRRKSPAFPDNPPIAQVKVRPSPPVISHDETDKVQNTPQPTLARFSLVEVPTQRTNRVVPYILGALVIAIVAGGVAMAIGRSPQPGENDTAWVHGSFADGAVELDYPKGSFVAVERVGRVGINTTRLNGFVLLWLKNVTGTDVGNIIAGRTSDPDFPQRFSKYVASNFLEQLENEGGRITFTGDSDVRQIGSNSVIVVDVLYDVSLLQGTYPVSALFFVFDCEPYTCELMHYKPGSEPFTPAEWAHAERVTSSVSFGNERKHK